MPLVFVSGTTHMGPFDGNLSSLNSMASREVTEATRPIVVEAPPTIGVPPIIISPPTNGAILTLPPAPLVDNEDPLTSQPKERNNGSRIGLAPSPPSTVM